MILWNNENIYGYNLCINLGFKLRFMFMNWFFDIKKCNFYLIFDNIGSIHLKNKKHKDWHINFSYIQQ